jgi:O-antigen/teichoic acid export membrane protein
VAIRKLFEQASTYAFGDIVTKAAGLLLLPLYTAFLAPTDYGILAIAAVVSTFFTVTATLGIRGAALKFYFDFAEEVDRRAFFGTVLLFYVVVPGVFLALIELGGRRWLTTLIPDVSYDPYLRIALWTAYVLAVATELPQEIFRAADRARSYTLLNVSLFFVSTAFVVWQVVLLGRGAEGALVGRLIGAVVVSAWSSVWLLRYVRFEICWRSLGRALAYSTPLVPHFLSHWILSASDRAILQAFVPLADVGIYSVGYTVGAMVSIIAIAGNNALIPHFGSIDGSRRDPEVEVRVVRLVKYYVAGVSIAALGVALFSKELILVATPTGYHGAIQVVPWVVLGYLLMAFYYPAMNVITLIVGRTRAVGLVTMAAAGLNIFLNLALIPFFGIVGAAMATAVSYGALSLIMLLYARHLHPLRFETSKAAGAIALAVGLFIVAWGLAPDRLIISLIGKLLTMAAFVPLLYVVGFFDPPERRLIRSILARGVAVVTGGGDGVGR